MEVKFSADAAQSEARPESVVEDRTHATLRDNKTARDVAESGIGYADSTEPPTLEPGAELRDPDSGRRKKRKLKREKWELKKAKKLRLQQKEEDGTSDAAALEAKENAKEPAQVMPLSERNLRKRKEFMDKVEAGCTILIDCEWESWLTDKELKSLSQQILFCYGLNKEAPAPCRLVLSGVQEDGKIDTNLLKLSGFKDWQGFRCESEDYMALYEPQKLIYLSADADEVLTELEQDKVYIIGGQVDRNRLKNSTYEKATLQGIRTMRLPIKENIKLGSYSTVLAVNHVMNILLKFQATKDWPTALQNGIPSRKAAMPESEAQT